jgi:hypothetical protein
MSTRLATDCADFAAVSTRALTRCTSKSRCYLALGDEDSVDSILDAVAPYPGIYSLVRRDGE